MIDYFRWRNEDAHRNALNAYCYWTLRKEGASAREATDTLEGLSVADKNELLFQRDINFNDLPSWRKRGIGLYWQEYEKKAMSPQTGETGTTTRRRIYRDFDLPMRDEYSRFIAAML